MGREEARKQVEALVQKYERVVSEGKVKGYNEEMTKKDFILPLFRALGWAVEDSSEVTAEENISKKRVDYSFRINAIPKFFLEAKALKEELAQEKFIMQAINYAWHKGCTWAVLTDFESVMVFNAEWKAAPLQSHFMTITCQQFVERFEDLWLLSRESFEQGLLDAKAEQYGKKAKKVPVDKQLLADFTMFREILSKSIMKDEKNRKLVEKEEELDEAIQRLLDRLIFIRNCEDRELEERLLVSKFREWKSSGHGTFWKVLKSVFAYFDKEYNSKIFAPHLCDQLTVEDKPILTVISGLYETADKTISYNFAAIEADVLGNIYEQYLGHILTKTAKMASVSESKAKRKEQGIYYTPTYIVDYIVRNTLGELLKDKKVDPAKIRVLDPACGSGSFLIKAFDVLNEHYGGDGQTKLDTTGTGTTYSKKLQILKENIHGVDLDRQAVEIAQLNLLLKVAEKGHRLPLLQENIQNGNSLIEDDAVAGEGKGFKWNERFKRIMDEGGFDVIIGNPPWLMAGYYANEAQIAHLQREYTSATGKFDLYYCFIELSLKLLSENGIFGMIIPNKFFHTGAATNLRRLLIESGYSMDIIDFGYEKVFADATNYSCILLLRKSKKQKITYNRVKIDFSIEKSVSPDLSSMKEKVWNFESRNDTQIFSKLKERSETLDQLTKRFGTGVQTGADKIYFIKPENLKEFEKEKDILKVIYRGRDIRRYVEPRTNKRAIFPYQLVANKFVIMNEETLKNSPHSYSVLEKEQKNLSKRIWFGKNAIQLSGKWYGYMYLDNYEFFKAPHLLTPSLSDKSNFTIGTGDLFVTGTAGVTSVVLKDIPESTEYILGVLNSKLISFFVQKHSPVFQGGYHKFSSPYLRKIPIRRIDFKNPSELKLHNSLKELVMKMHSLQSRLVSFADKRTDEQARIEEEIKKTDAEIDDLVYKLYGVTDAERKVIES